MASTQEFLEFNNIEDGIIILKNQALRSVISISSINFALKSEEEQNAILGQFQNFINSLDFSCQILVQSRKLNLIGYLDKLEEIEKGETNKLLKRQTAEYRKFISGLIETSSIMQKNFYIVVPFSALEIKGMSALEKGKQMSSSKEKLTKEDMVRAKSQLLQRVEFILLGLKSIGINAVPLDTKQLIELLWGTHHQIEAENSYLPEIPEELL